MMNIEMIPSGSNIVDMLNTEMILTGSNVV